MTAPAISASQAQQIVEIQRIAGTMAGTAVLAIGKTFQDEIIANQLMESQGKSHPASTLYDNTLKIRTQLLYKNTVIPNINEHINKLTGNGRVLFPIILKSAASGISELTGDLCKHCLIACEPILAQQDLTNSLMLKSIVFSIMTKSSQKKA